uniref:Uncharacterized protein n=1 Tax=Arundo donax TaxID=35708 RepID=A0A0A9HUW8_ARUDO
MGKIWHCGRKCKRMNAVFFTIIYITDCTEHNFLISPSAGNLDFRSWWQQSYKLGKCSSERATA